MEICGEKVILRDLTKEDIEKRLYFNTVDTEWQMWDSPWQYEGMTKEEKEYELSEMKESMENWLKKNKNMPDTDRRYEFQIADKVTGECIGWCIAYHINDDYEYDTRGEYIAVGIDLPPEDMRGKGYGMEALGMFIEYLKKVFDARIYTQTWSGNVAMVRLAGKLGFVECNRVAGIYEKDGIVYDEVTYRLK
ncbi:MAG: GNAT family protein [Lachnospiraceae bacterium]|nr:GNAT family N-acetyltransferase [Lachnospiraceae bacterium]MEE0960264.1 GNAT family protein [Lachnospiraceae bacterium]